MRRKTILLGSLLALVIIFSGIGVYTYLSPDDDRSTLVVDGVEIMWFGFASFKLTYEDTVIYLDPYEVRHAGDEVLDEADYIVTTHAHIDHYSTFDLRVVSGDDTLIFQCFRCGPSIGVDYEVVAPNDTREFDDVSFEFVPMYTVNKFRSNGNPYHPKDYNDIGVIIDFGHLRIYYTGSTDRIEEMKSMVADVVILPVSGRFYMTSTEAAGAVEDLKINSDLRYAIPSHFGEHDIPNLNQGSDYDAEQFAEKADVEVVILEPKLNQYT
jgi:L-ascorbate metabolism protein UlaG (beta-lactamase superfamily)